MRSSAVILPKKFQSLSATSVILHLSFLMSFSSPSFRKMETFCCAARAIITLAAPQSFLNFSMSPKSLISASDPPFAMIGIRTLSAILRIASMELRTTKTFE